FLGWPPLLAVWLPHVGPGTPVAVAVAVLVVARGPELAGRLRWRPLLVAAYATSAVWTLGLALVDGWTRGVVERLSSDQEYLHDVPRVTDIGAMLRTCDGGAAGVVTVLIGASAGIAVAVAVRALSGEDLARRVLPFAVLFPGAVWVGVSADGMFAAVLAWGVALLAVGATGHGGRADGAALAGGVLLGWALYQSYGLVLGGLAALAVVAATRRWRAVGFAALGVALVVLAFTLSGFWWVTGLERTRVIYAASVAATRPYAYFVWANLAAVTFAVGPAVLAGIRPGRDPAGRRVAAGAAAGGAAAGRGRARRPARGGPVRPVQGRGRTDLVAVRRVAGDPVCPAAAGPSVAGGAGGVHAGREPPAADGLVSDGPVRPASTRTP
ncbi:MAG: hypothetical protein NTW05_26680, partial [Pseudonocardiales bacterium]|nr:hypothetical protein [Pseudonocardiales bacterium]